MADFGDPHTSVGTNEKLDPLDEFEDGEVCLGDWLEIAEATNVADVEIDDAEFYEDLSLPKSWSGQSPKDLLLYLTRKSKKALKFTQEETSSLRFGGGFLYRINIPKNYHKNKKELQITDTKLCRNKEQALNLISTKALFRLFRNIPLQLQLPEPFRSMWISWIAEEEEQHAQHLRDIHQPKVEFVQNLLSTIDITKQDKTQSLSNDTTGMQNDMLGFMQAKLLGNRRPKQVKHSSTEVAALFKIRLASAEYKSYEKNA